MINLTGFLLTSLLFGLVYCDLAPIFVPEYNVACPIDFVTTCDLQCPNGNYVLDGNGCPTCACATTCPQVKCRANCGVAGYVLDGNGCQTCRCVSKVECSRVMCRMYCEHGFKRDENGCEDCACNRAPQECPQLNCEKSCLNGYRKDYSGCQTCDCECPARICLASSADCKTGFGKDANGCPTCSCADEQEKTEDKCLPLTCELNCKYGLQRDESGCEMCACNQCPASQCRMYCMYGFRKNEDGCEVCECDWSPVADNIQCDERIQCPETRICNLNVRLCEKVNPDRVNWFLYDFEVKSETFNDDKYVQTFKNGLIRNIASKYGLEISQIAVSSVEENGLTSFQIMPYFNEDMDVFEKKMDQIDIDLNSHEFRTLLPAVARVPEEGTDKPASRFDISKWCEKFKNFTRSKLMFFTMIFLIVLIALIVGIGYINMHRQYIKLSIRSDSKTPIYDTSYQLAGNDDEHYHTVSAPDGTKYVVVATDDMASSSDKRALV